MTYSIHNAYDHSIVRTFDVDDDTKAISLSIAEEFESKGTCRFYVHNGVGVVSAIMTRDGMARQIVRDDYMKFSPKAIEARTEANVN